MHSVLLLYGELQATLLQLCVNFSHLSQTALISEVQMHQSWRIRFPDPPSSSNAISSFFHVHKDTVLCKSVQSLHISLCFGRKIGNRCKYFCENDQVQRPEWKWKSAIVKQNTDRPSEGLGNIWSKQLWKNDKRAPWRQNIKKWRLAQDFCTVLNACKRNISEARSQFFVLLLCLCFL